MGKLQLNYAADFFDKIDFNNQTDWETYPATVYVCYKCQQEISFVFKNFEKHRLSEFTNFNKIDANYFQEFVTKNRNNFKNTNSFLDFYCPKCQNPVRIYYTSWAGGKHGEYGYRLEFIIH